jgi:hypothetical protein
MELIKDYELEIHYHLGKGNIVADALSRKEHYICLRVQPIGTCCDPNETNLRVIP